MVPEVWTADPASSHLPGEIPALLEIHKTPIQHKHEASFSTSEDRRPLVQLGRTCRRLNCRREYGFACVLDEITGWLGR